MGEENEVRFEITPAGRDALEDDIHLDDVCPECERLYDDCTCDQEGYCPTCGADLDEEVCLCALPDDDSDFTTTDDGIVRSE